LQIIGGSEFGEKLYQQNYLLKWIGLFEKSLARQKQNY